MKFVLVNHRTPLGPSACLHCSRPLGCGYLREISTQRPYCDHDCYRRDETRRMFSPFNSWFAVPGAGSGLLTNHPLSFGLIMSLAAAASWSYALPLSALSVSLVQAALGMRDLMAKEVVLVARPR
jgi:hypothetical protein